MAHTFDTSSSVAGQTGTSITLSHTVAAGASIICVGLICNSNTARAGGAPTFAGLTMTQAGTRQVATGGAAVATELWYYVTPPTGANNIVVPNTGAISVTIVGASFINAGGLQSILDVAGGAIGNSTNPTASVTTTYNGDALFSVAGTLGGAVTAGRTSITTGTTGTLFFGGEYFLQATAAAAAMNWTAASGRWATNVISIREAARNSNMMMGLGT